MLNRVLLFVLCIACTPAHVQSASVNLVKLDQPINLSVFNSEADNRAALQQLRLINELIQSSKTRLDSARTRISPAQEKLQIAGDVLSRAAHMLALSNDSASRTEFTKATTTFAEAEKAFKFAMTKWSAQYSRYQRVRARRILVLKQIYEMRPAYVNFVGIRNTKEYYSLEDNAELVDWISTVQRALDGMAVFEGNIAMLIANQATIEAGVVALASKLESLGLDYSDRLSTDLMIRIFADVGVSVSNIKTGGPVALFLEAGYQVTEAAVYLVDKSRNRGLLNDYSWHAPPIPEAMQTLLKNASDNFLATDYEEAKSRLETTRILNPADVANSVERDLERARLDNSSTLDSYKYPYVLSQVRGQVWSAGWNTTKTAALATVNEITNEVLETSVHPLNPVPAGARTRAKDFFDATLSPILKRLKLTDRSPYLKEAGSGLKAGVAVAIMGEAFKVVADELGTNRTQIVIAAAEVELDLFLQRRQMVAHRLLMERYIENALSLQEQAFQDFLHPPKNVASARRIRNRTTHPVMTLTSGKTVQFIIETNKNLPLYPVMLYPEGTAIPMNSANQPQRLREYLKAPNGQLFAKVTKHDDSASPVRSFSIVEKPLLSSNSIGVFAYPYDFDQFSPDVDGYNGFFLDLDPSTPVTHFDEESLSWVGQERYVTADSLFLFDWAEAVEFRIRNQGQTRTIRRR